MANLFLVRSRCIRDHEQLAHKNNNSSKKKTTTTNHCHDDVAHETTNDHDDNESHLRETDCKGVIYTQISYHGHNLSLDTRLCLFLFSTKDIFRKT